MMCIQQSYAHKPKVWYVNDRVQNFDENKKVLEVSTYHGLWTPNEAFFHQNTKLLGLDRPLQIDWYLTKIIWTVKTHFGPIEGQRKTYQYYPL